MADDAVVHYCRSRERYLDSQRETKDERQELADAYRTLGGLLSDSMARNGVRCVRVPTAGGDPHYMKLTPPGRRARKIQNVDDVVSLIDGIAACVRDVPAEALPAAVAKAVERRAREQGTAVPPKVQVLSRVGVRETISELDKVGNEVSHLCTQLGETCRDRKQMRERMKPLRDDMKRCEKALLQTTQPSAPPEEAELRGVVNDEAEAPPAPEAPPATSEGADGADGAAAPPPPVAAPAPAATPFAAPPAPPPPSSLLLPGTVVQMAEKDRSKPPKLIRVVHERREVKRNVYGLRNVCKLVQEAVSRVGTRDEAFEERLKEHVRCVFREAEEERGDTRGAIRVRRYKPPPTTTR